MVDWPGPWPRKPVAPLHPTGSATACPMLTRRVSNVWQSPKEVLVVPSCYRILAIIDAVGVRIVECLDRTGVAFLPNLVDFEGQNRFRCELETRMFAKVTS